MEQKQPIVIKLIPPARLILSRQYSPVRNINSEDFEQQPRNIENNLMEKISKEPTQTQPNQKNPHTHLVYHRLINERWNIKSGKVAPPSILNECKSDSMIIQTETLKFSSSFESGNLKKAEKVFGHNQYNLTIQNDTNTYGYTQWYYFRVQNNKQNIQYKFNITNFYKKCSLYQKGMKILVYSSKESKIHNLGWHRGGSNIKYYKNGRFEQQKNNVIKQFYTLSFTYTFKHADDQVYFAYNYPYTLTDLKNQLNFFENQNKSVFKRSILCRTLAENSLEVITITSNDKQLLNKKKIIFLTARAHPGETVSSYVIQGVIKFLMSNQRIAQQLKNHFIFKIIPMINPDGVVHGHYRTTLSGHDPNRQWLKPDKVKDIQVFHLKKYILECQQKYKIVMFCDFHGHSKKKNSFIYGCQMRDNRYKTREFPYLLSKICKNFQFGDCRFGISNSKRSTARGFMWKTLEIPQVFTLETSFCGSDKSEFHFNQSDLEDIGKKFCEATFLYFEQKNQNFDKYTTTAMNKRFLMNKNNKKKILEQLYSRPLENMFQTQGSDSDPQIDKLSDFTRKSKCENFYRRKKSILMQPKYSKTFNILDEAFVAENVETTQNSSVKPYRRFHTQIKKSLVSFALQNQKSEMIQSQQQKEQKKISSLKSSLRNSTIFKKSLRSTQHTPKNKVQREKKSKQTKNTQLYKVLKSHSIQFELTTDQKQTKNLLISKANGKKIELLKNRILVIQFDKLRQKFSKSIL